MCIRDRVYFEVTGFPYTGPGPSESFKATLIVQNPVGASPTADIIEINWQVMNGPVALVTVTDKVCASCTSEMYYEDSQTELFKTLMETTTTTDALVQDWSVATWGMPSDRC